MDRHSSLPSFRRRVRRGFSLLELMVAVAITAILVAVLVPAFVHVRAQAGLAEELSRGRQLAAGYSSYASDNDFRLMPGVLANNNLDSYKVFDDNGDEVTGESKQRWLWRLAPYLDFQVTEMIQDDGIIRRIETATPADRQYLLTLVPGMGMNTEFVGGNEDSGAQIDAGLENLLQKKLVVRRMSQARRPAELMTFASARSNSDTLTDFIGGEYANEINGYFRVTPPYYASRAWADSYPAELTDDPDAQSFQWGNIALRHNGRQAAAAFLDGHVDSIDEGRSQDMRIWADGADGPTWTITD